MNQRSCLSPVKYLLLGIIVSGCILSPSFLTVEAGVIETLIEAHKRSVAKDVQKAINKANTLAQEGDYSKAFQLLFNAADKQRRTWRWFTSGYEEPMLEAHYALNALEQQLINEDQSPLMQWLRDTNVPIQERLDALSQLRQFTNTTEKRGETVMFRGQYQGTLVQIATSHRLKPVEKREILGSVASTLQASYVSEAERDYVVKTLKPLLQEVELRFQEGKYVDAFILMGQVEQKAKEMKIPLDSSRAAEVPITTQEVQMRQRFVQTDTSSLMLAFKDSHTPTQERQYLLYDLRALLVERTLPLQENAQLLLNGKEYTGTFVEILTHPEISWVTKEFLLIGSEAQILKKEPDYTPDWLLPPR